MYPNNIRDPNTWEDEIPDCTAIAAVKVHHDDGDDGGVFRMWCWGDGDNIQAFFSCSVKSFHSPFIRSRRAIHNSACSWGAIPSQRFSISASCTLLTAYPELLRICCWLTATRAWAAGRAETEVVARGMARMMAVRNIFAVDGAAEGGLKNRRKETTTGKERREAGGGGVRRVEMG